MVENINCISCKLLPKLFATWLIFVSFDQVMIGGWHWWILMHFYYTFTPESRKLRRSFHWEVSPMNNLHLYNGRFWRVLVHSRGSLYHAILGQARQCAKCSGVCRIVMDGQLLMRGFTLSPGSGQICPITVLPIPHFARYSTCYHSKFYHVHTSYHPMLCYALTSYHCTLLCPYFIRWGNTPPKRILFFGIVHQI